jgi:hypothetical protein
MLKMISNINNFPTSRDAGVPRQHLDFSKGGPTRLGPGSVPQSLQPAFRAPSLKNTFMDGMVRDLNSGTMRPELKELVDAVLYPKNSTVHKVQVKTFALDGIQARDIIFIQRVPPTANGPNIALYIPDTAGRSFQDFKNTDEMNTWLKGVAADPVRLDKFVAHFSLADAETKVKHVKSVMKDFKDNNINAIVRPYRYEADNIFERLERSPHIPPAPVNGLTDLKWEREGPEGQLAYSGKRPDGKKVIYEYDAYGNFLGADRSANYYFVKNGLNSQPALHALTFEQFKNQVSQVSLDNSGANDVRGFYDEFLHHLENPAYGMSDALHVFGVPQNAADTVERYLDNPMTALLIDLNKNNHLGKIFGIDKATMDADLKQVGDFAQGFVPYYGQARMLASLTAKALKNQPLSNEEKRDLADAMALKPGSQAREHLFSRSPGRLSNLDQPTAEPKPAAPTEPEHTKALPTDGSHHPGMVKIEFQGNNKYYVAEQPDAGDSEHYLLRVEDPNDPSKLVSSGIIGKPDEAGVWRRRGVRGGGAGNSTSKPFDPGTYDYPSRKEASRSADISKIDKQLKQDADNFHKKAKSKAMPVQPAMHVNTPIADVIKTGLKESPGMIFGEDHSQSAGLRVIMDNVLEFKNSNVKTFYSEGFEHSLQPDLDKFYDTGEISLALHRNLKLIDGAHQGHGIYTNRNLLLTLRKHGIRIKAIDVPSTDSKFTRIKNMNYYATKVIERDQALNPEGKWIARVGTEHVFTYDAQPRIRGIAELTGATGVSVDETPANRDTAVIQSRNKTEIYIDLKRP